MKTKHIFFGGMLVISCLACQRNIKNTNADVRDEVVQDTSTTFAEMEPRANSNTVIQHEDDLLGYWVGDFRNAEEDSLYWSKMVALDEGLSWNRDNKINISINKLDDGKVYGHSVVAGNYRPFEGTYQLTGSTYDFEAKEPGDDRYDGAFSFSIPIGDTVLSGTWNAFKNIDIQHRKYDLQKKNFVYRPEQLLVYTRRYANWDQSRKVMYEDLDEETKEAFGEFYLEFETSTDSIYSINASDRLLVKEDVENLRRGDLFIIRNTIYARHGYSFKNRPLRVFFDAQQWYIPVHNDIKKDLTDMEKENIRLLMKYEKNAKTYYDTFGRG